jgi:hypothetical protein
LFFFPLQRRHSFQFAFNRCEEKFGQCPSFLSFRCELMDSVHAQRSGRNHALSSPHAFARFAFAKRARAIFIDVAEKSDDFHDFLSLFFLFLPLLPLFSRFSRIFAGIRASNAKIDRGAFARAQVKMRK